MDVFADFRVAVRGLSRSKGFTVTAALTLALGIATTTTVFSVIYGVLLRPLPYPGADRLVVIQAEKAYSTGPRILNFSAPELEPFVAATHAFSSIALSGSTGFVYQSANGVELVAGATVSGQYFSTVGARPLMGRTIADESEPVIVISERLWHRLFARDAGVIGRSMRLSDRNNIERIYTIVGIMPADFQLPSATIEVWRTLAFARATGDGRVREIVPGGHEFIARVNGEVSFDTARIDAETAVDRALKPHFTINRLDLHAKVTPLDEYVRGPMGPTLWVLMGAVSLVLLLACANVANLILVRQTSRSKEISVRLALGAPRRRLLAHFMCEGIAIATIGALVGVAITAVAVDLLQWMQPAHFPRLDAIAVDLPVMLFSAGTAAIATLLAALSPAMLATRTDASLALHAGTRGTTATVVTRGLRSTLVVGEIATSIMLVVGALLLTRTLIALTTTDLGVNTDKVLAASLDLSNLPGHPMDDVRRVQVTSDLQQRLAAMPLVRAVGLGGGVPPNGEYMRVSFVFANGGPADSHIVTAVPASPGYFSALQIPLLAGRLFDNDDTAASTPVVIVNREAARRLFGDATPLGRTLPITNQEITIVGVVDNVKYTGIAAGPEPVIYRPFAQSPISIAVLFARTTGDPGVIAADVRRAINAYDAGIGITRLQSLDAWISDATAEPRFRALLLSSIAGIAILLAMIGLYGVVAYSMSQRTAEMGLRVALGAQRSDVMRLVLSEGARLTVIGVAIGLAGAYWAERLLAEFLYGVTTGDPVAFGGSAAALLVVALAATYLPARRAASIDPAIALRAE